MLRTVWDSANSDYNIFYSVHSELYWSRVDLVSTSRHTFVIIIISKYKGQQYFAISMKDYHILQDTVRQQAFFIETENVMWAIIENALVLSHV